MTTQDPFDDGATGDPFDDPVQDPFDDPILDPDSDPGMLNPRSGAQAHDEGSDEDDTDADPDNLNPRDLRPDPDDPEGSQPT